MLEEIQDKNLNGNSKNSCYFYRLLTQMDIFKPEKKERIVVRYSTVNHQNSRIPHRLIHQLCALNVELIYFPIRFSRCARLMSTTMFTLEKCMT